MQQLQLFKDKLADRSRAVAEASKEDYKNLYYLDNPEKAGDIEELIEANLEHVLQQEALYTKIQFASVKKAELREIKEHAEKLTKDLKSKAEQKFDLAFARQREHRRANLLVGSKRDYLVRKFATILL